MFNTKYRVSFIMNFDTAYKPSEEEKKDAREIIKAQIKTDRNITDFTIQEIKTAKKGNNNTNE